MITVTCRCGHQFEEPDYMQRRTTVCSKCLSAVRVTPLAAPTLIEPTPESEAEKFRLFLWDGLAGLLTAMVAFPVFGCVAYYAHHVSSTGHQDMTSLMSLLMLFVVLPVLFLTRVVMSLIVGRIAERFRKPNSTSVE